MSALAWIVAAASVAGMLLRPFRIGEAWWAAGGAVGLVVCGALSPPAALDALRRGTDVYLFLVGMMALAEFARRDGLFDWVAREAARLAGRSRHRLFALVYGVGIITTVLFSNDATIVVLTPAVIGTLRRFRADPVPHAVACALVANAASFVLPISNPSNLLVFAGRMPALATWLGAFALPSVAAIALTYAGVAWWYRRALRGENDAPNDDAGATPSALGIVILAIAGIVVVATSAIAGPLGLATFACASLAWIVEVVRRRDVALAIVRDISWPVIALTAALFVIVTAVDNAGAFRATETVVARAAAWPWPLSSLAIGYLTATASNVVTNLPVGLNVGETLPAMHAAAPVAHAALIGINLGPNVSINGSLATILWLAILRRERIPMTGAAFFLVGCAITLPVLAITLALVR